MGYEIPQQLEYKEKIIFGLTFKQLAYAGLFGGISLILFFKLPLNLYVKTILSSLFTFLGVLFMFFNFDKFLIAFIGWYKNRKVEVKDFKDVKDISIIKVEPINFKIKRINEQKVITETFQKFLNSLEFPIQILINTTSLSLDQYLNKLEKRINKDYSELFNSHKEHLKATIKNNAIMNRDFYIIIPNSDKIKISIVEDKLDNLNLKHEQLEDPKNLILHKKKCS